MILVKDLISQTMQDPSDEAETAYIKYTYLIVIFSNLNGPNSSSMFFHAGFHLLALFAYYINMYLI